MLISIVKFLWCTCNNMFVMINLLCLLIILIIIYFWICVVFTNFLYFIWTIWCIFLYLAILFFIKVWAFVFSWREILISTILVIVHIIWFEFYWCDKSTIVWIAIHSIILFSNIYFIQHISIIINMILTYIRTRICYWRRFLKQHIILLIHIGWI